MVLVVDALTRADAAVERVLHLDHLGHLVREFDEPFVRVAAGQDEFDVGGLVLDEVDNAVDVDEFVVEGDVDLVEYDEVVFPAGDDFPGLGERQGSTMP